MNQSRMNPDTCQANRRSGHNLPPVWPASAEYFRMCGWLRSRVICLRCPYNTRMTRDTYATIGSTNNELPGMSLQATSHLVSENRFVLQPLGKPLTWASEAATRASSGPWTRQPGSLTLKTLKRGSPKHSTLRCCERADDRRLQTGGRGDVVSGLGRRRGVVVLASRRGFGGDIGSDDPVPAPRRRRKAVDEEGGVFGGSIGGCGMAAVYFGGPIYRRDCGGLFVLATTFQWWFGRGPPLLEVFGYGMVALVGCREVMS
jgi:hypothetical protein